MKKVINIMLFALLLVSACSKENLPWNPGDTGNGQNQGGGTVTGLNEAGYGPSTEPFKHAAWELPSGIQLKEKFHHFMYCFAVADTLTQEKLQNFKGVPGGVFQVCFTLRNTTSHPVTIDFPETLVLESSTSKSQNGLLIQLGQVIIPANTDKVLFAGGFCLNKARTAPDVYDDDNKLLFFSTGPSTIPAALKEVYDIIAAKHITYADLLDATGTAVDSDKFLKASLIQKAIWEITDEGGLTEETRAKLKALTV